ncbi:MAG: PP2C family protein-serine/threonine phosphatase [Cyclonatronaceae bacterium]
MIYKSDHIVFYAGVLGLIIFLIMRPSIDLHTGATIQQGRAEIEQRMADLAAELGVDTGPHAIVATRIQDAALFTKLQDSVFTGTNLTPSMANRATYPLSGWNVFLSRSTDAPGLYPSEYHFFESLGVLFLNIDDHMRVRYAVLHPSVSATPRDTVVAAELAEHIIFDLFGYEARFYRFLPAESNATAEANGTRLMYEKIARGTAGPEFLEISLHRSGSGGADNYSFREFRTMFYSGENYALEGGNKSFDAFNPVLLGYAANLLVVFVILFIGIRQIFRGRVEWRRGLTLGLLVAVAYFLWTFLFLQPTYYRIFSPQLVFVDHVSNVVSGLIFGFYICIGYLAWESISREHNLKDVRIFDTVWQARIFHTDTGKAILSGYAVAGIMLAILAAGLFAFGAVFAQYDSAFQAIREPSSLFPSVSAGLNVWMTAVVIGFVNFGVIVNYLRIKIRKAAILIPLASLFTGLMFIFLSRLVTTTAGFWQELIIFSVTGLPLLFCFLYFGLMSVLFSAWAIKLMIIVPPYLDSGSFDVFTQGLILLMLAVLPLLHGILAYLYGSRLPDDSEYIPEYEQILAKQLRFEREFEIAKSSQHALMPKHAPELPGIDVQGFFIPSFEVGGDFYDFAVQVGENNKPEALAIAVADVSGKSIKAAFSAIFTSGLLLSRMSSDTPEQVLRQANPVLYQKTDAQSFITCQVCTYELATGLLRVANAGHCPPLIKRGSEIIEIELPAPKFPLAVRPDVPYTAAELRLEVGDVLLLYSDGLPEARNRNGERLEFEGVRKMLTDLDTDSLKSAEICDHIRRKILTYSDYELADDTTVVCLKVD